jgi:arylsulfatase A-like enzyme
MQVCINVSGVGAALCGAVLCVCAVAQGRGQDVRTAGRPNIVFILADDLGIGDVGCYNAGSKIKTPNLDSLAAQGMRFTDAHSPSSVCTPTRYGVLTGRYAWRTRLQKGVLFGLSAPLVAPGRLTVAGLLKRAGYHTACVGKWHLGLGWPGTATDAGDLKGGKVDYTKPLTDGPLTHGFDQFFGISASLDMPPFVWIENDRVTEQPTAVKKWLREGPAGQTFEAVDVLPELTARAVATIDARAAAAKAGSPFFIYLPYASPHTPIVPSPEWRGRSGVNPYADFVMQTDHGVGQVLEALERNGLARDTLVVFTSDNGCSPAANVKELEAKGHRPSGVYRGYKADIWEGGHRVPFICRWPARTAAGAVSARLTCLTDFMATCAELTGQSLPDDAGEDSVSFAAALLGSGGASARGTLVQHSIDGCFAIREGNWKLEVCPGSGGWAAPRDAAAREQGLPPVQLYDMAADPSETNNLAVVQSERVQRLRALLERHVAEGRSTPGARQTNDVAVVIEKRR